MHDKPMKILAAHQVTGPVFEVNAGAHVITVAGHAADGKDWVLQQLHPERVANVDVWVNSDVVFAANKVSSVVLSNSFKYRMHGGTIGASAYIGIASFGAK